MSKDAALVLFSGGQDSTTCLAWALDRFTLVETVGFAYGQRNAVELSARRRVRNRISDAFPVWGARLGRDHELELPTLARISETALTRDMAFEMAASGLPNTFVPGRNLLFFTYAAALAYRRSIARLIGGMCETDYSGYPDCRNETLQALANAISLGLGDRYEIITPLMWLSKAATWAMAEQLGGKQFVDIILEETHTCYRGERGERTEWGYGCDNCPACELRANGYRAWRAGIAVQLGKGRSVMALERAELTRAVDLALAGDWQGAHAIVQSDEDGEIACWVHAVLHKIEGDGSNSRYWYRRTNQSFEAYGDAQAELAAIRALLTY